MLGSIDSAIDPDQEYIYIRKCFLLTVTYFSRNLVYPFTLLVTYQIIDRTAIGGQTKAYGWSDSTITLA